MASAFKYTYELEFNSMYPKLGGSGGGISLTIIGNRFSKNTRVSVGDNDCPIITQNFTVITCVVPRNVREIKLSVYDIYF